MSVLRRHVLLLIPSLKGGGAERVVVTLLRHLDRQRIKPILAVVDMRDAMHFDDMPDDVEILDLACTRVRYAIPKIVRLVWRRKPDVVFSTLGHLNLALSVVRPLLPAGVRYIARETSIVSETLKAGPAYPLWQSLYRLFYGRFDAIICQSHAMQGDLSTNFALDTKKMVVIHNPLDIDRIRRLSQVPEFNGMDEHASSPAGSIVSLVAAGRFSQEKGFDLLIRSIGLCNDPRIHLTLLGDGPLRMDLEKLAHDLQLERQIRFVGFQKNPYPFFAHADALVLSSHHEGFPNVVLEALACGTPVIATPALGGVTEILHGVDGCMLADQVSAEGLAGAIQGMRYGYRIPSTAVAPFAAEEIVKRYAEAFLDA